MSYSLQDCIQICKKEYPDLYPYAYIEYKGGYIFNLQMPGHDPHRSISDFHYVGTEEGEITGSIPTVQLMQDEEFSRKWQNAKLVEDSDQAEHSGFFQEPSVNFGGAGWAVRSRKSDSSANTGKPSGYSDELYHHGIPGQSWGVRNGPPYPLDQKTHNKVVKGEGANKSKETKGIIGDVVAPLAFVAADVLAYLGISRVVVNTHKRISQNRRTKDSEELSEDLIGDIAENRKFSDNDPPKQIQGKHSIEDDMAACNPKYAGSEVPGTTNNCTLCAFTYDMRRRGYDVTAKASNRGNYPDVLMTDIYKGARQEKIGAGSFSGVFENAAKKYPEGARGEIAVYGPFSGHSMAFEIRNGKMEVLCTQTNQKFTPQQLSQMGWNPRETTVIRTDHLQLRMDQVNKVCSELKPGWKKTAAADEHVKNYKQRKAAVDKARKESEKPVKREKMSKQEKQKSLEEQWKKDHPGQKLDAAGRESMQNWVNANMWSMHGHEGVVLIHQNQKGVNAMGGNDVTWGVRLSGTSEEELAHYGVKNQKWGVRRYQNEDGSLTPAGKEHYYGSTGEAGSKKKKNGTTGLNKDGEPVKTDDKSGSSKWKSKEAEELSDAELDRRNRRLQKERQYKDMTTPQWKKDAVNIGKEALKALLVTSAVVPLAVVMKRKYKFAFAKVRDFLHNIAGKPLPKPTNPESFFNDGKQKDK